MTLIHLGPESKNIKEKKLYSFLSKEMTAYFLLKKQPLELYWTVSAEMKKMNKQFRDKNKATDVLAFPSFSSSFGSIVIDVEVAAAQAKIYGHRPETERLQLFIHAFLHLVGFDHLREDQAQLMKEYENFFYRKLRQNRAS